MKDILGDLVNDINLAKSQPQAQRPAQVQGRRVSTVETRSSNFLKARGPGGMIFDFGNTTGNPVADRATALLNDFGDPMQSQIAVDQRAEFAKAIMEHITGQKMQAVDAPVSQTIKGAHDEWNKQLGKSFDEQTAEHVKKNGLGDGGDGIFVAGEFNKSTMKVGKEVAVAQSETDAAVIEMMKNVSLED